MALNYWRNNKFFKNATLISQPGLVNLDYLTHKNIIECNTGNNSGTTVTIILNTNPLFADLYYDNIFIVNTNSVSGNTVLIFPVGEDRATIVLYNLEFVLLVWDTEVGVYRLLMDSGVEFNNATSAAYVFNESIISLPTGDTNPLPLGKISGFDENSTDISCKLENPNKVTIRNLSTSKNLYVLMTNSLDLRNIWANICQIIPTTTINSGEVYNSVTGSYRANTASTSFAPWIFLRLSGLGTVEISFRFNNPNAGVVSMLDSSKFEIDFWR